MKAFKQLLIYIVCACSVVGTVVFLIKSFPGQQEKITSKLFEIESLGTEVKDLTAAISILNSIDQKQLTIDVDHVNAALPSAKKTSGFVRGIAGVASASGGIVNQITFTPGRIATDSGLLDVLVPNSKAHAVPAALTMNASLNTVSNFVKNIQAASQLIGIKSITFDPTVGGQPLAVITMDVYYEPENESPVNWVDVRAMTDQEREVLKKLSNRDLFILPEEQR